MYVIYKQSAFSAVDYAAEELRKYLRMMMPECGNVDVKYDTEAKVGFRLGLMQDFGLDVSDAQDTELDDIIYIDTDSQGGIIAGDNPRSVLIAVYEYFRQNGCRWLFPGVDGEFIPMQEIKPVKLRHKPTSRYRGLCNEGSEYQSDMLEVIDFLPKVGMNVFMMEFFIPRVYYNQYYSHDKNEINRPPEPVSNTTILQWKRQCESELSKRGLEFHDVGHSWTVQPFGIDSTLGRDSTGAHDAMLTPEQRQYMAMIDGRRKLWNGCPNHNQFCMSNPEARNIISKYVADYAENHNNSDYLHVWLGDGTNNTCECENCRKKITSDWYIMLLNEIDRELTARNLKTRIVYIAYTNTLWAPVEQKLKNHERFSLLFAPITRKYTVPLSRTDAKVELPKYELNKNILPTNSDELFAHLDNWMKDWEGANISYEYHFWRHQYYDFGGIDIAKVINGDIKFYCQNNIHGVIEDGSQRSFFPTGLAFYTYARSLFDSSLTAEEISEEYFSCAFGEDWQLFYSYLERLGKAFDFPYLAGEKNSNNDRFSLCYNPGYSKNMEMARQVLLDGEKLIQEHYNSEYRVRTVSVRLLEMHAKYASLMIKPLLAKALCEDDKADALLAEVSHEIGKYELAFERWYDHGLAFKTWARRFSTRTPTSEPVIML
jgi:hypothetical protein